MELNKTYTATVGLTLKQALSSAHLAPNPMLERPGISKKN